MSTRGFRPIKIARDFLFILTFYGSGLDFMVAGYFMIYILRVVCCFSFGLYPDLHHGYNAVYIMVITRFTLWL